jgi:hypothetical protein
MTVTKGIPKAFYIFLQVYTRLFVVALAHAIAAPNCLSALVL